MRIAKIKKYTNSEKTESKEVTLYLTPSDHLDDLDIFNDPKKFRSFVIGLKYYIRNCFEYKEMMKFLKNEKGMDCCGVHPNIKKYNGFSIHIHHTPFCLEDIVGIIIAKRQERNQDLTYSAIAEEIMQLHYMGLVGLYPLCETCHEYAHSEDNDLFIPLNKIYGDPCTFVELYKDYIPETLSEKFRNILIMNEGYSIMANTVPLSLQKKYIYVKVELDNESNDKIDDPYMLSNRKLYDLIASKELYNIVDKYIK